MRKTSELCGRAVLAAAVLLAFTSRSQAQMGFGNADPVVTSVSVSPVPVPASGSAMISCAATDDKGIAKLVVTVGGGTLPGGGTTYEVTYAAPSTSVTESVAWSTPDPGSWVVTCTVTDTGGGFGGPRTVSGSATFETVPVSNAPGIDALVPVPASALVGEVVQLSVTAHGEALTYAWSASGGTLVPAGALASFSSAASGTFTVTVTATDALGRQASASVTIDVALARVEAPWTFPNFFPSRIAVDASGNAYVSDPRAGEIVVFDENGVVARRLHIGGLPSGIAVSPRGELFVSDIDRGSVEVYDLAGRRLRALGAGAHEVDGPLGIALQPGSGRVYVGEGGTARIRVFEPGGAPAGAIEFPGGNPVGLAFDRLGVRLHVTDAKGGQVRVLDPAGALVRTIGEYPTITRAAGIAVANDGSVFVVDSFQSRVLVFSADGTSVGSLGTGYGTAPGELQVPFDAAIDRRGRVLVSNTQAGRIEVFALANGGGCPGDQDCDGMPDVWEIAFGLDPTFPGDAALDPDGDGLANLDEFLHGTDPRNPDTDGDGVSDGVEVLAGLDPTRADRPEIVTSPTRESDPGLVRLSATLHSSIACSVSWQRVGGLEVTVRDANTLTPSFVARPSGEVRLEATATCGPVESLPAPVTVTIRNVPPRPDPGRTTVVKTGTDALLDGSFSADGNGDPLALEWLQALGVPLTAGAEGALLPVDTRRPGLFTFQLSAEDGKGGRAEGEVGLLVVPGDSATPTAAVTTPLRARALEPVVLDASASVALGARFAWRQVAGPEVVLAGASSARASFVPPVPGHYAFTVQLVEPARTSPAARVDVFATEGAEHPQAAIAPVATGLVGEPISLDGAASSGGNGLAFAWRQVSGPAAGLTEADQAIATVVPFEPGSFVFELAVSDESGPGVPARVRFDAAQGEGSLPVARASGPAAARVRDAVRLDGTRSTSPQGASLRYRWTQIGGPWVALDDPSAPTPSFRPAQAGTYTFELEVDDGTVRSAATAVGVLVFPAAEGGR
jgi:hypothetical protein